MTANPKVPFLYAVCAAEDARVHFAEEAGRMLELYAKLDHNERNTAMTVLEALTLKSAQDESTDVAA